VRHDPDVPLRNLAWNRLPGPYWFHYTTRYAAEQIVLTAAYIVGERASPGLYVTDLMPGRLDDEQLLNALLDGMRQIERVQAAVVLHDDPALSLVPDGQNAWVHAAAANAEIDLTDVVVGFAYKAQGLWHYERSLWDF
jgi:hypothetical protein